MKFFIIDDHPMLRQGVAAVLRDLEPGVTVLEAPDGATGLALAAAHADLDAVLLDLQLTGLSGMDTLARLAAAHPDLPVVMLSASEDPAAVRAALAAGARGYCPKSASHATMQAAVRLVLAGEIYVPPLMAGAAPAAPRSDAGLTARQQPRHRLAQRLRRHRLVQQRVTALREFALVRGRRVASDDDGGNVLVVFRAHALDHRQAGLFPAQPEVADDQVRHARASPVAAASRRCHRRPPLRSPSRRVAIASRRGSRHRRRPPAPRGPDRSGQPSLME